MPDRIRELSPDVDRDVLEPARQIAARLGTATVELPHLLMAACRDGSPLARACGPDRVAEFRVKLERQAQLGPARRPGRPVPLGNAIETILSALTSGGGPPSLNRVLDRLDGTVEVGAVVAAALDYRPNPVTPLLTELGLSSVELEWEPGLQSVPIPVGPTDGPADDSRNLLTDLTRLAVDGCLDLMIGRERELDDVIRVLLRRRCNNPVLRGEAGVGKTAIVEGLAQRLAANLVPVGLRGFRLMQLDVAGLVAGTKYRGEFEARLQQVLVEVKGQSTILFIDEFHLIVGAGGAEGAMDTANILKTDLARGTLRCIGATTIDEFRRIEGDPALARRFSPVDVAELDSAGTLDLITQIAPEYEKHHRVRFHSAALAAIIRLAPVAVPGGRSPAREVDALDELGAAAAADSTEKADGERVAGPEDVVRLMARRSGLPVERVTETPAARLARVQKELARAVVGQDAALREIGHGLRGALPEVGRGTGPAVAFLFRGPAGVGKSLSAETLAEALYGPSSLVRIDLAGFRDETCRSALLGAPRGHVGYEIGGALTEPVRRRAAALVLFENVDRAHPVAADLVTDVLRRGEVDDNHGRTVSFRGAAVVLTAGPSDPSVGRNGRPDRGADRRWTALTGPAIEFRPLEAADIAEVIDRAIVRTFAAAVGASSVGVEPDRADGGRTVRLSVDGGSHTLRLSADALRALVAKIGGKASAAEPVVRREVRAALGAEVLAVGEIPQEVRIETFDRD